jgi:Prenyltransferase and squalene oxidase repeat
MQIRIPALVLASSLLIPRVAVAQEVPVEALRRAAQKGLALLESTSPTFIEKGGCNSCHNQKLAAAAQAFARQRGIPTGPTIAQLPDELSDATTERFVEYAQGGGSGISGLGYEFFARAMTNEPGDARVQAQLYYLKSMQRTDGSWGLVGNRPPITFDDVTATAFVVHALNAFALPVHAVDTRQRIDRARAWLLRVQPQSTQERVFHLLGLTWSKADAGAIKQAISALQKLQRTDGGWSQLPAMSSDAYATGMALYSMSQGGLSVKDAVYQKGLRYLLDTQAADGTWHVRTRSLPFQPYFETGYPYDHDQWISAAGAAYATMAITAAVEPSRRASR